MKHSFCKKNSFPFSSSCHRRQQHGFTLLEVLVALTITSLVLGGIFTLAAGSKRLAVSTQDSVRDSAAIRAKINLALIDNQFRDLQLPQSMADNAYLIKTGERPEDPIRRREPMRDLLQYYHIEYPDQETSLTGTRWIRLELPE